MAPKKAGGAKAKDRGVEVVSQKDEQAADIERFTEIIQELSKKAPAKVAPYVKQMSPYAATALVYAIAAMPYVVQAVQTARMYLSQLPEKVIYAALGFVVCFFGGVFPATIAAVEAWRLCGGDVAMKNLMLLCEEFSKVQAANAEDETKDDDGDGIPDVKQIKPKDLIVRKVTLVAKTVEPEVVSGAVVGIYTGWIGVLAILKIQFARTVTLGERIGEQIYRVVSSLEPKIQELVPAEYAKWVPTGMRWACKAVAIWIAWWITRVIAAFHSAIRGGLLFGHYLVEFLHDKQIINFTAEQAYLDEAIGWGLAALGLLFQYTYHFGLPFPLNLLCWPLDLVEAFIVWSVAS